VPDIVLDPNSPVSTPKAGPPLVIPPGGPTFDGFKAWVQAVMGVQSTFVPDDTTLQVAYDQALNLAYLQLANIPSQSTSMSIYAQAVYNLGGHYLVEFAIDNPNSTFWTDMRNKFGIYNFTGGITNEAHDQGTGEGIYVLPIFAGLTMMGLQFLKTPWGRAYLAIAGQWGPIWGLTP
jgi:hypothetical protein